MGFLGAFGLPVFFTCTYFLFTLVHHLGYIGYTVLAPFGDFMLAAYRLARITDTFALILDLDHDCSVNNDAAAVIARLDATLPHGIGLRRVYYRDTTGRFDELLTQGGHFRGFRLCTDSQQVGFTALAGPSSVKGLAT